MRYDRVPVQSLRPHPNQGVFPPRSEVEIKELVDSIDRDGQRDPIYVLPDDTILDGHARVEAAKRRGDATIEAYILESHDLEEGDSEVRHITDNLNRRQCDDLTTVRAYKRIQEKYDFVEEEFGGDGRDFVARKLNLSVGGRTLSRLLQLTSLPLDIQYMISAKTLTKQNGLKILNLPESEQKEAIRRLRAGEGIQDILSGSTVTKECMTEQGSRFLTQLNREVARLRDYLPDLDRSSVNSTNGVRVLDEAIDFLTELRDRKVAVGTGSSRQILESLRQTVDRQ